MKNIYLKIPSKANEIKGLVLATVIRTQGSTPQKPGSSALFNRGGLVAGTIGGGVIEGKVQKIAIGSIESGNQNIQQFMLDTSNPEGEDALCGGRISVLIDPLLSENLEAFLSLKRSYEMRIPGILGTLFTEDKDRNRIDRFWITENDKSTIPPDLIEFIEPEIDDLLSRRDSYDLRELTLPSAKEGYSRCLFLEPVIPLPKLVIAGAGHIGKALAQLGQMLDFEITIIDDRPEYANEANIQWTDKIIVDDIGNAIAGIEKGSDTYIVIVTRGHRDDSKVLKGCIGSGAKYIGMIGSRNKVALMKEEFLKKGWADEDQWSRIFAPIGLDIKSQTVEEIAVSIAAQLVLVKNRY